MQWEILYCGYNTQTTITEQCCRCTRLCHQSFSCKTNTGKPSILSYRYRRVKFLFSAGRLWCRRSHEGRILSRTCSFGCLTYEVIVVVVVVLEGGLADSGGGGAMEGGKSRSGTWGRTFSQASQLQVFNVYLTCASVLVFVPDSLVSTSP